MTGGTGVIVAGLKVPVALSRLVEGGPFLPDCGDSDLERIFHEADPHFLELYDLPRIAEESIGFRRDARSGDEVWDLYLRPGLGVDPELALLIGALDADMLIALDHRLDPDEPRVIRLGTDGWAVVAETTGKFCDLILSASAEHPDGP